MGLILINKTTWDTKQFRSLLQRVCKWEGYTPQKVLLENAQARKPKGLGGFGYGWVKLYIPKEKKVLGSDGGSHAQALQELDADAVKNIARTFIHEIAHNRGINHKEMDCEGIGSLPLQELDGIVIQRKAAKPKQDMIAVRKQHAEAKVRELEGRLKRTGTLLKKWKRKKNYYDKKAQQ